MYFNDLVEAYDKSRVERNAFHDLMRYHVREVLLVASLYESFVVESDGVLTEQIYGEYYKLHLNTVPRITCAYTAESALELFREGRFDLVVLIAGLDFDQPLGLARAMKDEWPGIPVLLMVTNNTSLAALGPDRPGLEAVDRVFVWNGYSKLFIGMLKQVEDLRNVDSDTRTGLVRVILLIEDSVRYYSRYLPLLFQVVQRQAQALIEAEKGIETHKLLRARARPKILLASSYEEAVALFERYEPYIMTVITDVRFPRGGKPDPEAGFDFMRMAKTRIADLPVMIQSSEEGVRERALALGAAFADKNSESLEHELASFLQDSLGFGPFMFRMPDGAPVSEARDIDEFMGLLEEVPEECLVYHAGRNDFSTWLTARGELRFAERLKPYRIGDFGSTGAMRDFILGLLREARAERARGAIPYYDSTSCRGENCLSRLGDGSVGGKGRGLVFIKSLLDNVSFPRYVQGLDVKIPRTAFIGIDEFELFLESNGMWSYAFYESAGESPSEGKAKDAQLRERFLGTRLSDSLEERLERFAADTDRPLAVRSSGLFEDMLQVPFSGIYETYMIPNSHPDRAVRARQLREAVKLIYASLFSQKTRAYFDLAGYALEEERMAVVVQELVGSRRGSRYYPHVSGTAQSYNYYPVSYLKPEDGLCVAALGLGSYVVGGGPAYRFCPKYPKLDVVPPERLREASQRSFRALDMEDEEPDILSGEEAALRELDIGEAEADPRFGLLASTWDAENDRLSAGLGARGPRIIDFANILKHEALPFAQAVDMILDMGSRSMGTPVEIEYALNVDEPSGTPALYLLQLKPLIRSEGKASVDIEGIDRAECFIYSDRSMGNGRDATVSDIVWVDPRRFERSETMAIAAEIEELDKEMRALGRRYVLVGPGRWGTRDRWLGVPVAFTQISMARVIVEADLPEFKVESSLGSHFFHNVTSMNIGYFTVPWNGGGSVDWDWLYSVPPARETAHCRRTGLPEALEILMDGRKSVAAIRKRRRPAPARFSE
jgi:DNA-binding NarL/FixJ family response regulator